MRNNYITGLLVLLCACLLTGCYKENQPSAGRMILQQHVLAGKIWDVNNQRFIDYTQLVKAVADSHFLLLGETHDNIEHHQHQARIIDSLARTGRSAAVYFEMIDDEQEEKIQQADVSSVDKLITLLDKLDPGWDYQHMYRPVFDSSMRAGFVISAANLSRNKVLEYMRLDRNQLPEGIQQVMARAPLPEQQQEAMQQEAVASHCDSLPAAMVAPMILAQQLRDVSMTMRLMQASADINILVTGSGHARKDRGVPHYLQAQPGISGGIVSLGFLQVNEGVDNVADYVEDWGDSLPFDYVWFTPRFDRPDPCVGLREHLKKKSE